MTSSPSGRYSHARRSTLSARRQFAPAVSRPIPSTLKGCPLPDPQRASSAPSPALPHGERRTYRRSGCRCLPCRAANATYERYRTQGCQFPDPAELVDAILAERHLASLARQGVGVRQAAKLAGVSATIVRDVRAGRIGLIRADTSARLLGVQAILAHGQLVTGWRSWRLINSLEREGFTRTTIGRKLGQRHGLQLARRHIRVKTALRVRALYRAVTAEGPDLPAPAAS